MKINPTYTRLTFRVFFGFIALSIFLLSYWTPQIFYIFNLNWAALLVLLLCLILPIGSHKLAPQGKIELIYPISNWWLRIIGLQLSLYAVFLGITWQASTILNPSQTVYHHLFLNSIYISLAHFGLFPWAMISLIAISFGYFAYRKQQDCYVTNIIKPNHDPHKILMQITNVTFRFTMITALIFTFMFMSILWAYAFIPLRMNFIHGFNYATLTCVALLIIFVITPFYKNLSQRVFAYKNPTPLSIGIFIIFFSILLIILSLAFAFLSRHQISVPSIVKFYQAKGWLPIWHIFMASWWFSWCVVSGIYIAKISRGYSIRAVILATLTLPIVFLIILSIMHHDHLTFTNFTLSRHHLFIPTILATIGFLVLLAMLTNKQFLPTIVRGNLPYEYNAKHPNFMLRRCFQFMVVMYYFYLTCQLSLLYLIIFAMILPGLIVMLIFIVASVRQLIFKGNSNG